MKRTIHVRRIGLACEKGKSKLSHKHQKLKLVLDGGKKFNQKKALSRRLGTAFVCVKLNDERVVGLRQS